MNISNVFFVSLIITAPLLIHSESLLDEFGRVHPTPSLGAVIDFLHEHQQNAEWCQSITLKLHLNHTEQTAPEDWTTVVNTIVNMVEECKKSDSNNTFPDIFGPLLKECYTPAAKGIHGWINISTSDINNKHNLDNINDMNDININFKLHRGNNCDEASWNNAYNEFLKFIKQMQDAENTESIALEQYLGKPLQTILAVKNINKNIRISFKDMFQDKLSVGYTE